MEQIHRDAIRRCFSSLVERTDLDLMVAALYEKGVFSDAMIEPYKDTTKDQRTRRRQLYRDITRRGPDAFQHLVDTLSENGYWDLVRELDPNSSLHPKPRPPPSSSLTPGGSPFLSLADKKRNTGKEQEDPNRNKSEERKSVSSEGESSKSGEQNGNGNNNTGAGAGAGDAAGHTGKKFNVVKSTRFFEDNGNDIKLYRTRGRNRGVLVQFSYISFEYGETYRAGATVDADNLKDLFDELGFKVFTYRNLKLKETKETIESLHTAEGMCEGPECVFIVFSSHGYARSGTGDTDIRCSDGHLISYYEIIEHFNNDKFPALNGIPKVFVFQTCRGPKDNVRVRPPKHLTVPSRSRHDSHPLRDPPGPPSDPRRGRGRVAQDGCTFRDEDSDSGSASDSDETARDRIYADILIAHSTVPGYVSSRDEVNGSWYIQALCEVFAARAHDCHVEKLFTLVDERLHKHFATQTSSVDRWGFNRRLYLHPGLYED